MPIEGFPWIPGKIRLDGRHRLIIHRQSQLTLHGLTRVIAHLDPHLCLLPGGVGFLICLNGNLQKGMGGRHSDRLLILINLVIADTPCLDKHIGDMRSGDLQGNHAHPSGDVYHPMLQQLLGTQGQEHPTITRRDTQ